MIIGVEDRSNGSYWLQPSHRQNVSELFQYEFNTLFVAFYGFAFGRIESSFQTVNDRQQILNKTGKSKVKKFLFLFFGAFAKVLEFRLFAQESIVKLFLLLLQFYEFFKRNRSLILNLCRASRRRLGRRIG